MSKEEDIERLSKLVPVVEAQRLVGAGFGYLGDAEAKQPAHPGELLEPDYSDLWWGTGSMAKLSQDERFHDLWSSILSDRAATEARVRAEYEGRVTEIRKILEKQHGDEMEVRAREVTEALDDRNEAQQLVEISRTTIADLERKIEHLEITKEEVAASVETGLIIELRTTIADLENRLENAVEIPKPEVWPEWATGVRFVFCETGYWSEDRPDGRIWPHGESWSPRPTPAKLTPEQMAEAWVLAFEYEEKSTMGAWQSLAKRLASGESIETLYAEIKGGA